MSAAERTLFESFLHRADRYVEFGAGGSTFLAAQLARQSVIALDSARDWLERVAEACEAARVPVAPELLHVDIGPTGRWGYPEDDTARPRWPHYHLAPWTRPEAAAGDFFLVDGRFRVACALQCALRAAPDALIAVHDFSSRHVYQPVLEALREVARAQDLSIFVRRRDFDRDRALRLLAQYAYNPI